LYCKDTELVVAEKVDGDSVALPCVTQDEVTPMLTGEPSDAPDRLSVSAVWP